MWDYSAVAGMNVSILYEDNHLLVAVKPPMVPSQQDSSGDLDMLGMMKEYIKRKYHKPGEAFLRLVHRLDRPTGGIMVFAPVSYTHLDVYKRQGYCSAGCANCAA